jgi:hypothetical protein
LKINKRGMVLGITAFAVIGALIGVVYAAFSDKGQVLRSSFSVGNADIKILKDVTGGISEENLADEISGPSFTNIGSNWTHDYLLKLLNNGTYTMQLISTSNYATVNDPDDLRQYIFTELFPWLDTNTNGIVDTDELGESLGRKTVIKWKTEGFDLGSFTPGEIKGFVLRFSTDTISDTKQGKTGVFDFVFDSIEQ